MQDTKTLYLLETDDAMRASATLLLSLFGWTVVGYARPEECLQALGTSHPRPACLVAAVDSASAVARLHGGEVRVPTVMTTDDVALATDVRRRGAQCLARPYDIKALLLAIGTATAETAERA